MKTSLTRSLVCYDESVRHPFRQRLPLRFHKEARTSAAADLLPEAKPSILRNEDVALFAISFLAFFTAISAFIA